MPAGILIKSNRKKWVRLANATAKEMSSPSLLNAISSVIRFRMQTFSRLAFDTEGASTAGGRWKRLSPLYARLKARAFPGKTILRRTDRLHGSYTSSGGEHIFNSARRGGKIIINIGSNVPYSQHQRNREVQNPTAAQLLTMSQDVGGKIKTTILRKGWVDGDNGKLTVKNTGFDRVRGR